MNPLYLIIAALVGVAVFAAYRVLRNKKADAGMTAFYDQGQGPPGSDPADPNNLTIGPHPNGVNRSVGTPLHPEASPDGPLIRIPVGRWDGPPDPINLTDKSNTGGHVHGVVYQSGPLAGKTELRARFRIFVPPGGEIWPHTAGPGHPAIASICIQRALDNWSAAGKYLNYRFYTAHDAKMPLVTGDYEISVPLDIDHWTPVDYDHDATGNAIVPPREVMQAAFAELLANAQSVQLCLGGGSGLEHGLCSNIEGATITMLSSPGAPWLSIS